MNIQDAIRWSTLSFVAACWVSISAGRASAQDSSLLLAPAQSELPLSLEKPVKPKKNDKTVTQEIHCGDAQPMQECVDQIVEGRAAQHRLHYAVQKDQ